MVDEKDTILQDIADAIREKDGTTDTMYFREMADRIRAIPSGGGENRLNKYLTQTLDVYTEDDMNGVTKLQAYAFYEDNNITYIPLKNVTRFGSSVFYGCSKLSMQVEIDYLESGNDYVFYNTGITALKINDSSVTASIGGYFAQSTPLTEIDLENSKIIGIGNSSFRAGSGSDYRVIKLPPTITNIGSNAFQYNNISIFSIKATIPPTLNSSSFRYANITKIVVPAGSLSAYQTATNWSVYANIMEEATE